MVHLLSPGDCCCMLPCSEAFPPLSTLIFPGIGEVPLRGGQFASGEQLTGTAISIEGSDFSGFTFPFNSGLTSAQLIQDGNDVQSPSDPVYNGLFVIPVSPDDPSVVQFKLTVGWSIGILPNNGNIGCRLSVGRTGVIGFIPSVDRSAPVALISHAGFIDPFNGNQVTTAQFTHRSTFQNQSQVNQVLETGTSISSGELTLIITNEPNGDVVAQGEVNGLRSDKSFVLAQKESNQSWCNWAFIVEGLSDSSLRPVDVTILDYEHSTTPNL